MQLVIIDTAGLWGLGSSAAVSVGAGVFGDFTHYVATDAIKNLTTAGARQSGNIIASMRAAREASKIAVRTIGWRTALATISKASGIITIAATASSALDRLLGYIYGDCLEECSQCK